MTNNCGNCKFREVESYEEPCSSCRCTGSGTPTKWVSQHEPQTNADRIRAMSDEELAVFLWEFEKEEIARTTEYALERRKITEWLRQPAEGE